MAIISKTKIPAIPQRIWARTLEAEFGITNTNKRNASSVPKLTFLVNAGYAQANLAQSRDGPTLGNEKVPLGKRPLNIARKTIMGFNFLAKFGQFNYLLTG